MSTATRTPDLTAADVALELGVSTQTVSGYFERGVIPGAYRLPRLRRRQDGTEQETGAWRIPAADFDHWKNTRRGEITDPYRIEPRTQRARAARSRR